MPEHPGDPEAGAAPGTNSLMFRPALAALLVSLIGTLIGHETEGPPMVDHIAIHVQQVGVSKSGQPIAILEPMLPVSFAAAYEGSVKAKESLICRAISIPNGTAEAVELDCGQGRTFKLAEVLFSRTKE